MRGGGGWIAGLLVVLTLAGTVRAEPEPRVLVLRWSGAIGPIAAEYLEHGVERAAEDRARLLVLVLDTPGGLDAAMRRMVQDILASETPVAVYVSPGGARAASAGVFLLAAAPVAAMAPATNAGAAHPVKLGGKMDDVMAGKATNDAVAYLESLAAERSRPTAWCDDVVRESVSVPADSALALGMIDVVAADLDELISWCDGRVPAGGGAAIRTDGAWVVEMLPSWRQRFLRTITDPSLAYLFLMLGVYGLFFELSRPGAVLPGVVGALGVMLAVLAFQGLPVNYVGVGLVLLGMLLLVLEIKVTSFGALTVGGTVSLLLGSVLLFEHAGPLGTISLKLILPVVLFTVVLFLGIVGLGLKAQRRAPTTGADALLDCVGVVRRLIGPADGRSRTGVIEVLGEHWSFDADTPVALGDHVTVTACADGRVVVVPTETPGG